MVSLKFGPTLRTLLLQVLPTLSMLIVLGMQFLKTIKPIVDWVNKSLSWMDAEKQRTVIRKKWSNSRAVQLVLLDTFYKSVRDSDCTGSWKVQITP